MTRLARHLAPALLAAGVSLALQPAAQADPGPVKDTPGVFVLGIDGVDPVVLQRLMDEGKMPHFERLANEGTFQSLGTSNPPQSPVAWSNFVTGMNPGGHGVYDFIHRDPKTYGPLSSAVPPPSGDEPTMLDLFGYTLPLWGGDEIVNNRSGTPFWDHLHAAGVDVEVYRMPGNFPPTPSEAKTLSGMGTDDLRALNGKYAWYTTDLKLGDPKAEFIGVSPDDEDEDGFRETIRTVLKGPPDAMRSHPPRPYLEIPLTINIDPEDDVCWIRVGAEQAIVRQGEWSGWVPVSYEIMPYTPVTGMVRFYAKELRPGFKLYVSPINFDPLAPAAPITTPDDGFAAELAAELGPYYTQGMPEETNALKDGLFDDADFVKQVQLVHEDGHRMLDLAMSRFESGDMSFVYLSDIDLQCHMLWHHSDIKYPGGETSHPAHEPQLAEEHGQHLIDFYAGIDAVLGRVRETLPAETMLVVISDHGFQPYTRKVNLNAWLHEQGYLVMLPEGIALDETGEYGTFAVDDDGVRTFTPDPGAARLPRPSTGSIAQVDWNLSKAYGLGFNGLYLNLEGRERVGIVSAAEAPGLLAEIGGKLEALVDPETGRKPVLRTYPSSEAYSGTRTAEAPDLVVGYDAGFGCSDTSTLGGIDAEVIVDNTGHEFTGNHLMAPEVVPGILLVNRKLARDGHDLTDVTASLLDYYGLSIPDEMVGRSFLD